MKRITVFVLLLTLLAACGGSTVEPTTAPTAEVAPTEVPTEVPPTEPPPTEPPPTEPPPTAEPTEEVRSVETLDHVPDSNLVGKRWAWIGRNPNDNQIAFVAVANPESYTLTFNEDGTFSAQLDCNMGSGNYATSPSGEISMELGPMTMAACPEGSLAPEMSQIFGGVLEEYRIEGDGEFLVFPWSDEGPIDTYRKVEEIALEPPEEGVPTGTVNAPAGVFLRTGPGTNYPYLGAAPQGMSGEIIGVSQDGEWWVVAAPNLRGGQVWVSAQYVDATGADDMPVVPTPSLEATLVDLPWQWANTTTPAEVITVNDPTRYHIIFAEDGTAQIKADCNSVLGTYSVDGQNISIQLGPSTLAACPEDSQDSQFLDQLSQAVIYFVDGGNLYLDLPMDSGTMRFIPQGTRPPAPAEAPAGPADGRTFYIVSYGPEGAETEVIPGSEITASFSQDTVSGSAGCNNYSATLTPVEDYFTVGPIATTRMACAEPAGVMDQETSYLTALEATSGYQWQESVVNEATIVTAGQLFYTLPDGTEGVINLVSTQ